MRRRRRVIYVVDDERDKVTYHIIGGEKGIGRWREEGGDDLFLFFRRWAISSMIGLIG